MVADIKLLQGKIVENPDEKFKNISSLIQELALEMISESELSVAATYTQRRDQDQS